MASIASGMERSRCASSSVITIGIACPWQQVSVVDFQQSSESIRGERNAAPAENRQRNDAGERNRAECKGFRHQPRCRSFLGEVAADGKDRPRLDTSFTV